MVMHPRMLVNEFEVVTRSEALLLTRSKMAMRSKISLMNGSEVATVSFETEMSEWIGAPMVTRLVASLANESEMAMAPFKIPLTE